MHSGSRRLQAADRRAVLRRILAEAPVSRQRLSADTGRSVAEVASVVGELVRAGLVAESGAGPEGDRVAVDPEAGALLGVDIAETYVEVELFDTALTTLARARERLEPERDRPEAAVESVAAGTRGVLESADVEAERVLGAGVAVPGETDIRGGTSVFAPALGWHDAPMQELFAEHLPFPLRFDTPLRAVTAAESWFGAAQGHRDAAVIVLGVEAGAGLVLDGEVYRGAAGSAGEWGHTPLVLDGRACHCGNRGCVEGYVSAPGILRNLRERAPESPLLRSADPAAAVDALAAAWAEGDPVAFDVVADTARYLGAGIAGLINLVNPTLVVLAGLVADRLGPYLLPGVREAVAERALRVPRETAEIVLGPLGGNPVTLGAAVLALERLPLAGE